MSCKVEKLNLILPKIIFKKSTLQPFKPSTKKLSLRDFL